MSFEFPSHRREKPHCTLDEDGSMMTLNLPSGEELYLTSLRRQRKHLTGEYGHGSAVIIYEDRTANGRLVEIAALDNNLNENHTQQLDIIEIWIDDETVYRVTDH